NDLYIYIQPSSGFFRGLCLFLLVIVIASDQRNQKVKLFHMRIVSRIIHHLSSGGVAEFFPFPQYERASFAFVSRERNLSATRHPAACWNVLPLRHCSP